MDGDDRDDHDRKHDCRPKWSEKAGGDEQPAREFADGRSGREENGRAVAHLTHHLSKVFQAGSAKPPEQLLRAMRRHQEPDRESRNKQTDTQCL